MSGGQTGAIIGIALKSRRRGPMVLKEQVLLHKNIGLDGVVTGKGFRQVTLIESEKMGTGPGGTRGGATLVRTSRQFSDSRY